MENAADALKMAGAVLLFVIALSVVMTMFSKVRQTASAVIQTQDETSYYDYIEATEKNRIVGMETILPTMYKYYKENYAIVFRRSDKSPLPIYMSNVEKKYWNTDYLKEVTENRGRDSLGNYLDQSNCMVVCSLDLENEIKRNEPWTQGGNATIESRLDLFVKGGKFYLPNNTSKYIDYGINTYGVFFKRFKNTKFIEELGRIQEKESMSEIASSLDSKKIIYYTQVN